VTNLSLPGMARNHFLGEERQPDHEEHWQQDIGKRHAGRRSERDAADEA
jgi:hypothetical protein